MKIDLTDRVAWITGASRGVGQAVAIALGHAGARCILSGRDQDALIQTASLTEHAEIHPLDLHDPTAIAHSLDALAPRIDILVHCAAPRLRYAKLHTTSTASITEQLQVKTLSAVQICQGLLPKMMVRRWGRIVLIGSLANRLGARGSVAYNLSNAALESLGRSIALEYARYHICANTVVLGPIDGQRLAEHDAKTPGARDRALTHAPGRRLPTPTQVANVITFLCSEQAAPINGTSLDVTAGSHLNTIW